MIVYTAMANEKKWSSWIGKQLRNYIHDITRKYDQLPIKKRESNIWVILNLYDKSIISLIDDFSKRWIPTLWRSEHECIHIIQTPGEMLYMVQYVQNKYFYTLDFGIYNILTKFIYHFTIELWEEKNMYVIHSLSYNINLNKQRLNERQKFGELCLNRIQGFDWNIVQSIVKYLKYK